MKPAWISHKAFSFSAWLERGCLYSSYPAGDSFQCTTKVLSPSPAFTRVNSVKGPSCALLYDVRSGGKPLPFKNRWSRSRKRVSDVCLTAYGKRPVSVSLVEECRTPITCVFQYGE